MKNKILLNVIKAKAEYKGITLTEVELEQAYAEAMKIHDTDMMKFIEVYGFWF